MKRFLTLGVAVMALLALNACKKEVETETQEEKVENVETLVIKSTEIDREISLPTNLDGYQTVKVSSTVSGIIKKIHVEVGDRVAQGQTLVTMDPTQYTNYKLQLENARVEMKRMDALKEAGSVSQQVYDQTKVQVDQLEQTVALYRENTYITADFAGVIAAKNFEDGELCAGQPILTLTQVSTLKSYLSIPETYLPQIKRGMPLKLQSDVYPDKSFDATVEIVYPTVNPTTHTFTVKTKIPNASGLLRPGMYMHTELPVGRSSALVVPYQAVLKLIGANTRYVFLNNQGRAKRVEVELGKRFDKYVEIVSEDIHDGDEIVVAGQGRLVDGVKLNVKNVQPAASDSIQ
ncbi:MAG: efflux RND transporter periplasmic adaptor subunit [Paludibacteraceae bacterium]|nr:efflux RND transporter periplasmic adaptor subunit [Paludibacteraceae bacterium]